MTTQRTTQNTVSGFFAEDVFNFGQAANAAFGAPTQGPKFRVSDAMTEPKSGKRFILFRIRYESLHGGGNLVDGAFEYHYDRYSGPLDGQTPGHLLLPTKRTAATSPDPTGDLEGLHSANFNSLLYAAAGGGANVALVKETSATDPTIAAVTFTPKAAISSMAAVTGGGAAAAETLAIGYASVTAGHVVEFLDTSHAISASGHANTRRCWGIIQTFLNDNAIAFYIGGASGNASIGLLDSTVALSTAPSTYGLTNVPNGGTVVGKGIIKLGQASIRLCFLWPYAYNLSTDSALKFGAEKPMHVVTTSFEATDHQEIPVGIKDVYGADIWQDNTLFCHNKRTITRYDGIAYKGASINWIGARENARSNAYTFECRGIKVIEDNLWIKVQLKHTSSPTVEFFEVYDIRKNAIIQKTKNTTLSGTGAFGILPGQGGFPFSEQNLHMHDYGDGSWRHHYVFPYGQNPYWNPTNDEFDTPQSAQSVNASLPGLDGMAKRIFRIWCGAKGDAASNINIAPVIDGTVANVDYDWLIPSSGVIPNKDRWRKVTSRDLFEQIAAKWTITQGAATFTPNALPTVFDGVAWIDEPDYGSPETW